MYNSYICICNFLREIYSPSRGEDLKTSFYGSELNQFEFEHFDNLDPDPVQFLKTCKQTK